MLQSTIVWQHVHTFIYLYLYLYRHLKAHLSCDMFTLLYLQWKSLWTMVLEEKLRYWRILIRPVFSQTSYLSQISQIISVEKNLSCGEISDFCKEFEQFMEFYRNLCRFCSKFVWRKICVEKISVEKK